MPTPSAVRFRHVLCPIDFSPFSRAALRYAAAIADRHDSQLTVVYANDPLLTAAWTAAAYDAKVLSTRTHTELRAYVRRVLGHRTPPVRTVAANGRPADEIRRLVRKEGIDLVVMGSRGLTNVGKWVFGSTTEATLRGAEVPVLIVPKTKTQDLAPKALRAWPTGPVIVPVDIDDASPRDLRTALRVIKGLGAPPRLLYVVRASPMPRWLSMHAGRGDSVRVARARQRLVALARSVGLKNECQVAVGDPADQIALHAAAARAQLVVFTIVTPKTVFGPRRGSITYRVLASGSSPVLALPSARH